MRKKKGQQILSTVLHIQQLVLSSFRLNEGKLQGIATGRLISPAMGVTALSACTSSRRKAVLSPSRIATAGVRREEYDKEGTRRSTDPILIHLNPA